jgi:hypothetical protein
MPLLRYFIWVGSVLFALLFIFDACLPRLSTTGKTHAVAPVLRIYSDQKWPERIVYDTSAPMIGSTQSANLAAAGSAPPVTSVASPKFREAFAELRTTGAGPQPADPKRPRGRPQQQHRFAKKNAAKPVWLLARRSPLGWFGPTIW